jgi:hypothetical protein
VSRLDHYAVTATSAKVCTPLRPSLCSIQNKPPSARKRAAFENNLFWHGHFPALLRTRLRSVGKLLFHFSSRGGISMRRFVIVCSLVMVVSAASAQAQSLAAKEAEIRAAVPYASMLREIPTLTWQQYEAAVRDVARAQSGPTAAIPAVPSLGRNSTSSRTGSTTFYNSDDGVTGTAQRIGPTTYYNFSNGTNGTSQRIGQSTFSHFNNGSQSVDETTTRVGSISFTISAMGSVEPPPTLEIPHSTISATARTARRHESVATPTRTATDSSRTRCWCWLTYGSTNSRLTLAFRRSPAFRFSNNSPLPSAWE